MSSSKGPRTKLGYDSNRLPKHCNRLQLFEINWNVINTIWKLFQNNFATGNRLHKSGNRLPESKNSLVNMFWEKSCAIQFLRKTFHTYLDWAFSWFLNLESWILILILEILNLEFFLIHLSCSLIDLWFTWVLWLIFELFVITFVIIFCYHHCYHQNTFDSSWSFASTQSTR